MSGNLCRCGAYNHQSHRTGHARHARHARCGGLRRESAASRTTASRAGDTAMRPFEYARAGTLAEALAAVAPNGGDGTGDADGAVKPIAGGTNLVDLMKADAMRPARLVDITRLPLKRIEELPDGGLRLGALVHQCRHRLPPAGRASATRCCRSAILAGAIAATAQRRHQRRQHPAAHALLLLLRLRHALQQAPSPAPAAARSAASTAFTRSSAPATSASPPTPPTWPSPWRPCPPSCSVTRSDGEREIPFAGLPPPARRHARTRHQPARRRIITAIDLPPQGYAEHSHLPQGARPRSYAFAPGRRWPAALRQLEGGTIRDARLALGGVAHKPWRDARRRSGC